MVYSRSYGLVCDNAQFSPSSPPSPIGSIPTYSLRLRGGGCWFYSQSFTTFQSYSGLNKQITNNQENCNLLYKSWSMLIKHRVAKCHGYDGYTRVKKLASWGKNIGRVKKIMYFWEDLQLAWFNIFSSNKNSLYRVCLFEAIKCTNVILLGVKFSFEILIRVKNLTFCNSD